jgi:drug/metabolite transporter (DMT)-like permease
MKMRGSPETWAGVAVALVWGLTFLSIKVVVDELPPMTLSLVRFVIASVLLPMIAWATKTDMRIRLGDMPIIALSGLVGVTFYFYCENNGIMLLSASESSIIIGTIPVLTLIVDMIVYKVRMRPVVSAGILLSFIGVSVMVIRFSPAGGAAAGGLAGYLYMLGAVLAWVAYSFITKPLGGRYPLLSISFWQIFFGMIGSIPFALAERHDFSSMSAMVVLNVLFLGVLGSALGYWFYVIMLDRMGPSRSSVFINLIPVVSVIAAYFVLGERLSPRQLLGGAMAVTGVFMATR